MTAALQNDLTVDEVLEFWRGHKLAAYDVTDYTIDESAHWRDRALTVEDVIFYLSAKCSGAAPSFEWFNFGAYLPTMLELSEWWKPESPAIYREQYESARKNEQLIERVKAHIPDYEEELARRNAVAQRVYREGGDMVA